MNAHNLKIVKLYSRTENYTPKEKNNFFFSFADFFFPLKTFSVLTFLLARIFFSSSFFFFFLFAVSFFLSLVLG